MRRVLAWFKPRSRTDRVLLGVMLVSFTIALAILLAAAFGLVELEWGSYGSPRPTRPGVSPD